MGDSEHGTRILACIPLLAAISLGITNAQETPPKNAPPKIVEIEQTGETTYRFGQITFDKKKRTIQIPTQVCVREQILEYALVHENGKTHESLLSTTASALRLHTVLLLLNYEASQEILNPALSEERAVTGETAKQKANAALSMTVSWKDPKTGKQHSAPIESWMTQIDDKGNETPVSPGPFTLTGSRIFEGKFLAELDGNILAVYLDPNALINNPRKNNFNDDAWGSNTSAIPPLETEVTLIISPASPTTTQ